MATIWCINANTLRPGVNEIGDVVDVLEDGIDPGPVHKFDGIALSGIPAATVKETLRGIVPTKERAFHAATTRWSLDKPEEKTVWKNTEGKWCFLEARPKYKTTLVGLSGQDKETLANSLVSSPVRLVLLSGKAKEKCALDEKNLIEVTDLNG